MEAAGVELDAQVAEVASKLPANKIQQTNNANQNKFQVAAVAASASTACYTPVADPLEMGKTSDIKQIKQRFKQTTRWMISCCRLQKWQLLRILMQWWQRWQANTTNKTNNVNQKTN